MAMESVTITTNGIICNEMPGNAIVTFLHGIYAKHVLTCQDVPPGLKMLGKVTLPLIMMDAAKLLTSNIMA